MNSVSLSVDVIVHVLILFAFLSAFFFFYIVKLEKNSLKGVANSAVNDNTNTILDYLAELEKKLPGDVRVNWGALRNWASNLIETSQGETPAISLNNKHLLRTSIIVVSVLLTVFLGLIAWGKYMGYDIGLRHILMINLIVFCLAGACEFVFFQKVASRYIPITPDVAINEVLNTLKTGRN